MPALIPLEYPHAEALKATAAQTARLLAGRHPRSLRLAATNPCGCVRRPCSPLETTRGQLRTLAGCCGQPLFVTLSEPYLDRDSSSERTFSRTIHVADST